MTADLSGLGVVARPWNVMFTLASMIVISVVLSLVLAIVRRFF